MHIFQLEAKLKMHTKKIYKQQQKQRQQQQHNPTTLNNGYFSFTTYFPHILFLLLLQFLSSGCCSKCVWVLFLICSVLCFHFFLQYFFPALSLNGKSRSSFFRSLLIHRLCMCVCVLLPFCYWRCCCWYYYGWLFFFFSRSYLASSMCITLSLHNIFHTWKR